MAAKKLFTQIFIYFSKPLRLLYSLIIYEIVNFSFFTLYSLLLLSFFLYLKSVPIYVIVHVCRIEAAHVVTSANFDSFLVALLMLALSSTADPGLRRDRGRSSFSDTDLKAVIIIISIPESDIICERTA